MPRSGPGSIACGDQAPCGVLSLAGDDPYRFRPPGGEAASASSLDTGRRQSSSTMPHKSCSRYAASASTVQRQPSSRASLKPPHGRPHVRQVGLAAPAPHDPMGYAVFACVGGRRPQFPHLRAVGLVAGLQFDRERVRAGVGGTIVENLHSSFSVLRTGTGCGPGRGSRGHRQTSPRCTPPPEWRRAVTHQHAERG